MCGVEKDKGVFFELLISNYCPSCLKLYISLSKKNFKIINSCYLIDNQKVLCAKGPKTKFSLKQKFDLKNIYLKKLISKALTNEKCLGFCKST